MPKKKRAKSGRNRLPPAPLETPPPPPPSGSPATTPETAKVADEIAAARRAADAKGTPSAPAPAPATPPGQSDSTPPPALGTAIVAAESVEWIDALAQACDPAAAPAPGFEGKLQPFGLTKDEKERGRDAIAGWLSAGGFDWLNKYGPGLAVLMWSGTIIGSRFIRRRQRLAEIRRTQKKEEPKEGDAPPATPPAEAPGVSEPAAEAPPAAGDSDNW